MILQAVKTFSIVWILIPLFLPSLCLGQGQETGDKELSKEAANPVTTIFNLPLQNNFNFGIGENERTQYLLSIQPVRFTFRTGQYRIRSFSLIPVMYQPNISQPQGGKFGLGDINLNFFFTNRDEQNILWGIGPSILLPTATDRSLGRGKWGIGPALAFIYKPKRMFLGFVANNLWSFAGDPERPKLKKFQMFAFIIYPLEKGWFLVSSPIISADWGAASGDRWLVPIGGGIGKLFRLGGKGLSLQVQVFYNNFIHPRNFPYPEWTFRFQFQYIFLRKRQI